MAIAFFGTGGTIANRGTGPDNYVDYLDQGTVMDAEELMSRYPRLAELAEIQVASFGLLRSKHMTAQHWRALAEQLQRVLADPDIDGAVVAHGTGTLEETAWFLHLVLDTQKPVVVVGAQRPGSTMGSDTELNLADAIRIANDPQSVSVGVTVVMHRQIHSARDVTKMANHDLGALRSPVRGALGAIHANHTVHYWRRPINPHTATSVFAGSLQALPRVDIVHAYTDADATALETFLAAGAAGIIAVGYPPGTLPRPLDDAVDTAIAAGIHVVQASRAPLEPAVTARQALMHRGLIPNTDITEAKAKILLQLCLAKGFDRDTTVEIFTSY